MRLKYDKFFSILLFFIVLILIFTNGNKLIASTELTFYQTTLLNDFGVSIYYDHIQDLYIFTNNNNDEQILVDSSGLCIYKYTIVNLTKKLVVINQKLIVPEQLVFSFYKSFFIPIKNLSIYEFWYNQYKDNLEKNNKNDLQNDTKNDTKEEETKQEDKTHQKEEIEIEDQEEDDDSTQVQKDINAYYSYAQAKMVDFKVISFIILDAGHGGDDPGAVKGNLYEKDLTLKAVLGIKKVLEKKFPFLQIYLTRDKDVKVTLENRVKFANKYLTETKTGIFISIHANANPYSSKKSGIEVYYLDYDVIDEKIKDLVKYENKEVGESVLSIIINRLLNEQLIYESSKLANFCFESIKEGIKQIPAIFYKGAPFYVLAYSEMPAILVEMGYITNPNDVKIMNSDSFIDSLALALSKGIEKFIKEYTISEGFKKVQ